MTDRDDICRRHGLPADVADSLVGDSPASWEADAAARAVLINMFRPRDLNEDPPEPPIEGLAPRDKPVSEYTEAESAALHESFDRTMRSKLKRDQQDEERRAAEANRTPEEQHNDTVIEAFQSDKRARDEAFVRLLHPPEGDG